MGLIGNLSEYDVIFPQRRKVTTPRDDMIPRRSKERSNGFLFEFLVTGKDC